jgi:hypothetical protein
MRALLLLGFGVTALALVPAEPAVQSPVKTVKDGVLDEIALYVAKPPATPATAVVMRPFSSAEADLGTGGEGGGEGQQADAKTIKASGPTALAEKFVSTLKSLGPYGNVTAADASAGPPAGALVVEGKFTKLDPGSRAKRYLVGFGAGKSTVAVSGTVKDSAGATLATFSQQRHGAMGFAGGDSVGKLLADSKNIGEDIAKFLSAWAKEKSLK